MTREQMIRTHLDVEDNCDMLVCRHCMEALYSRGERFCRTESAIVDMCDLEDLAEDENEPCVCEWCGDPDDLYGIKFR